MSTEGENSDNLFMGEPWTVTVEGDIPAETGVGIRGETFVFTSYDWLGRAHEVASETMYIYRQPFDLQVTQLQLGKVLPEEIGNITCLQSALDEILGDWDDPWDVCVEFCLRRMTALESYEADRHMRTQYDQPPPPPFDAYAADQAVAAEYARRAAVRAGAEVVPILL